jgi:hypothetical protein
MHYAYHLAYQIKPLLWETEIIVMSAGLSDCVKGVKGLTRFKAAEVVTPKLAQAAVTLASSWPLGLTCPPSG